MKKLGLYQSASRKESPFLAFNIYREEVAWNKCSGLIEATTTADMRNIIKDCSLKVSVHQKKTFCLSDTMFENPSIKSHFTT